MPLFVDPPSGEAEAGGSAGAARPGTAEAERLVSQELAALVPSELFIRNPLRRSAFFSKNLSQFAD